MATTKKATKKSTKKSAKRSTKAKAAKKPSRAKTAKPLAQEGQRVQGQQALSLASLLINSDEKGRLTITVVSRPIVLCAGKTRYMGPNASPSLEGQNQLQGNLALTKAILPARVRIVSSK